MSLHRKVSLASALVVTLLPTTSLLAQSPSADLLVLHGHILTVDVKDSVAQALAIRLGIIVKVGTDAEVLELKAQDDDGCDGHVRFAYHQMFALLNNQFNADNAYIEPAHLDNKHNMAYDDANNHFCLDHDPQKPGSLISNDGNSRSLMSTMPNGTTQHQTSAGAKDSSLSNLNWTLFKQENEHFVSALAYP
jgi:hypothetical protein